MSEGCPCGMPFLTTDKCPKCGSAVHVYCMRETMCKWCLDSASGKRKARREVEEVEPANKKAKANATKKAKPIEVNGKKPRSEDITRSNAASSEASDTESELSDSDPEFLEAKSVVANSGNSETQLQRLKLLRLKAKVTKYQAKSHEFKAKAMEAHFTAETFAARIKLQACGVPQNDIDACLSSL